MPNKQVMFAAVALPEELAAYLSARYPRGLAGPETLASRVGRCLSTA